MDGVELSFDDEALAVIADLTIERNTGARGLRSIIEGILTGIMFEVPSDETVTSVTITADCARGKAKPVFTHGAKKSAAKLGSGKNITD